jgi:threonyl-tRNA synthetase
MIKITLPDGSIKEFEKPVTGLDIANAISPRLAAEVLAISVNGEIWDLTRAISSDASIQLHKWDDKEGKHAFWHSSAHLMAQAIEAMYPGTKFGIGPTIENGFYYDIDLPEGIVLSDKDLEPIEKQMLEFARQKTDITRIDISKDDALKLFQTKGDPYKTEIINDLTDGTITLYHQGNFTDLCRGPHLPNTEPIKAIKLLSIAGAYWRGNEKNKMLTRIYGISFPKAKLLDEYLILLEETKKRDHRKIGKEMELFAFSQEVGRVC